MWLRSIPNACWVSSASGGASSHTAVLARSLGLPSVVGLGRDILKISGRIIVDGETGTLVANPDEASVVRAENIRDALLAEEESAKREAHLPAVTRDGKRLGTLANVGSLDDAVAAMEAGAEGVGLLRSEFFFLRRNAPPSEEEQYQGLLKMSQALRGQPLVIRTLDIGGDKVLPYLRLPVEENPFLGVRGVRLCLEHPGSLSRSFAPSPASLPLRVRELLK